MIEGYATVYISVFPSVDFMRVDRRWETYDNRTRVGKTKLIWGVGRGFWCARRTTQERRGQFPLVPNQNREVSRRDSEDRGSMRGRKWGSPKDQFSLEIVLGIGRRKMSASDAPALGDDQHFGSPTIA